MKKNNNYRNQLQDKRLENVEKHIEVINSELGDVKTDMKGVKTDVAWLKRFFAIIATASIGGLIAGVLNLIFK